MATIWTLGYEGQTPESFDDALRHAGVERVVDVREAPVSRKPGFSKGPLSRRLEEAGVAYENRRDLGVPKDVRDRYKSDHAWGPFAAWYEAHLQRVGEQLAALAQTAQRERACLVCYEADAHRCHRSLLARRLADAGFDVVHL